MMHGSAQPVPIVSQPIVGRREMSCQAGYTLIDNRCVMTEVIPGVYSCPPGHVLMDQQCLTFSRGQRNCPDGFRFSGSRCIMTEVVPSELMCDEGHLDAAGSMCQILGQQSMTCPHGFVMTPDQQCTQTFAATASCPEGYAMQHGHVKMMKHHGAPECVLSEKAEAAPVCPSGSQMHSESGKCFSLKPTKPRCPKGYTLSLDKVKCIRKVKKVLTSCPPGFREFSKHKSVCEKSIELPPRFVCSPGFSLNPMTGQCEMVRQDLSSVCAAGFYQAGGQCEQVIEKEARCPPGAHPIGYGASLRCQTQVDQDLIECCPPGFDLLYGICEKTDITPPTSDCVGECETVHTFQPELHCPEHYSLTGSGQCVLQMNHPCKKERPTVPAECEIYLTGGSLRSSRNLEAEQVPANCIAVVASSPPACPVTDWVHAERICPSGASLENGLCLVRQPLPSVGRTYCRVGTLDQNTGQCIKITRVPIKTECPDGTTRVGPKCVLYQDHPPIFECPSSCVIGSSGSCLMRAPLLIATSETVTAPPMTVCPSGSLKGSLCYDVERIPRQYVCPANSVPTNRHIKDSTLLLTAAEFGKYCIEVADFVIHPPHKKFFKPQYFCPDGSPAHGRKCHSHERVPAIMTCPPGCPNHGSQLCMRVMPAILSTGHVRSLAPRPMCPPGSRGEGTACVITREAPCEVICPPGYKPQPDNFGDRECAKCSPPIFTCPPGTQQIPEGCLQSKFLPPTMTIIPDCLVDCVV